MMMERKRDINTSENLCFCFCRSTWIELYRVLVVSLSSLVSAQIATTFTLKQDIVVPFSFLSNQAPKFDVDQWLKLCSSVVMQGERGFGMFGLVCILCILCYPYTNSNLNIKMLRVPFMHFCRQSENNVHILAISGRGRWKGIIVPFFTVFF